MINHARNLLLNIAPNPSYSATHLFDEIIDPNYLVKPLPSHLQAIRRALFGEAPDRTMLNYRSRELLALLVNTELQSFIADLDPRITYDLKDDSQLLQPYFQLVATQYSGATNELGLAYNPWTSNSGRLKYSWHVSYDGTTADLVLHSTYTQAAYTPSFTAGLSEPLLLPGTKSAYITLADSPATWQLSYLAKPAKDLGEVLADIDSLGNTAVLELFGIGSPRADTEPFKTFFNLWRYHYALPMRLGGILLALIYRTNEL